MGVVEEEEMKQWRHVWTNKLAETVEQILYKFLANLPTEPIPSLPSIWLTEFPCSNSILKKSLISPLAENGFSSSAQCWIGVRECLLCGITANAVAPEIWMPDLIWRAATSLLGRTKERRSWNYALSFIVGWKRNWANIAKFGACSVFLNS